MERYITLTGVFQSPSSSLPLTDVIDEYKQAFNENDRYFRISRNWQEVFDFETATDWTASLDAENMSTSSVNYQYGTKSVTFDVDVSNGADNQAVISNGSLTVKDLSTVDETGNFEFWIYIPNVYYITGVTFGIGNDASNTWEATVSSQYDNKPLQNGWNYISIPWESMTETGTVNPATLDFCAFILDYSSAQTDMQEVAVSAVVWQDDTETRNYPCYSEGLTTDEAPYNIDFTNFSVRLLNYTGLSESTNVESLLSADDYTNGTVDIPLEIAGTGLQYPNISIAYTTASNLDTIVLSNLSTNTSVTLDVGTVSGDILAVNTKGKVATKNGSVVDYNYVMPIFNKGVNILRLQHNSDTPEVFAQTSGTDVIADGFHVALPFTPTVNSTVSSLQILNRRNPGASISRLIISVWSDVSSKPGALLAYLSGTPNSGTDFAYSTYTGSYAVTGSTQYWLVFDKSKTFISGGTNQISDVGGVTSPNHSPKLRRGLVTSSWSTDAEINGDLAYSLMLNPVLTIDYDVDITNKTLYL